MTQTVPVKAHSRKGKWIKKHLRRIKTKLDSIAVGNPQKTELIKKDDKSILDVDSVTYEKIKANLGNPIDLLQKSGFNKQMLEDIVDSNSFTQRGTILIRNRATQETQDVKIFNFNDPNVPFKPPTDVSVVDI